MVPILGEGKEETDDNLPVDGADRLVLCDRIEARGEGVDGWLRRLGWELYIFTVIRTDASSKVLGIRVLLRAFGSEER